jgi:murein DD-endopeptidase MepM/ murein hydrolase activator NlpD
VAVAGRSFPEQRLTVDPEFVTLSAADLARHEQERGRVQAVLGRAEPGLFLRCPLMRPVSGELSSLYGLRRVFNNEPRSAHRGVDMRGASGTPVLAAAAGRVALAEEHFFSGRAVYLDHGQGVVSMYFHLDEIAVREGQFVDSGTVVGKVGMSGRVTGPHLHFGLSVLGQLVDPMYLLEQECPASAARQ